MTAEIRLADLFTAPDRDAFWAAIGAEPVVRGAAYFDQSPVWLVTGYDEAVAVIKDPVRFSNDINARKGALNVMAAAGLAEDVAPYMSETLGAYDPPAHTRMRKLVSRAFTVGRVEALRPRIEHIVNALIADFPAGQFDFIEEFAYPLPVRVICELLGVPTGDVARWRSWSSGLTSPDPARVTDSARGLVGYMSELITAKRRAPADDLISALIQVQEEDGDRLSDRELTSLTLTILLAGHETTVSLLSHGLLLLLTQPEQQARLRADLDRVRPAVEEMLRVAGPAEVAPMRYATEDVEIGGVSIPAGDPVQVVYATANRDPRRFEHPDSVDLGRQDNQHLAFGNGIHYCLGAALARVEGDLAFRTLLDRFSSIELTVPIDQLRWQPGVARALTALPVQLSAGAVGR